ncbi:zeta toxin family protein [Treponema primitia]|uniref:zeta toxin family protein n=1 Tax=Treponema primitia TaxID=88058 RepID=UPI0002554F4B|nr:zeta toxin family protein [Treponema primitia]
MAENSTVLVNKPKILCFAGPNGSGKSTITQNRETIGLYINADEIKKHRACSDLKAAEEAEKLRELCLKETKDFTFETVLSTERNLELLERAKKVGYFIESIYVLTADPALNIFRVKSRIKSGGHDVPVGKIRSRYYKSLANIPKLLNLCDECYIIDNTGEPDVIFAKNGTEQVLRENRYWSLERIQKLV